MKFTNLNIYIITVVFFLQTIINEIIFNDIIKADFLYSLYNVIFALSYCAIITKVLYNYCNIIWHVFTILFLYCNKYLNLRKQIYYSYKFVYKQLMNITVWNGMCIKYNYRNSLKPFITLSSIYNIFDNASEIIINYIKNKISINQLVHISCLLNIILIILNFKINDTKTYYNTQYFDLLSKKFIIIFSYSIVCNFLYISDTLTEIIKKSSYIYLFILQLCVNICAYKNYIKYFLLLLPLFLIVSKFVVKSNIMLISVTNNIQFPILYILCLQYSTNGRIYILNICSIMVPTVVDYLSLTNEYVNIIIILLYAVLYYIYDTININIKTEIQHDEENSIKNNIDIIINE